MYIIHREYCSVEGVCRCSKITHYEMTTDSSRIPIIISEEITKRIAEHTNYYFKKNKVKNRMMKNDPIITYGINRIATSYKIFNSDSFRFDISRSYYGEEVSGVYIENKEFWQEVVKFINQKNINDKIYQLLMLEYGYIPKNLKGAEFKLVKKNVEEIKEKNSKKIIEKMDNVYKNYDGILGIITVDGRIIDGHHRTFSCTKNKGLFLELNKNDKI